ncbi:hypothetical protein ECANGB1_2783 [Enterospora canceri]|uniref:GPI mannosyltransferase 2 n=1 Tax=Enterospora canceri TaxID=1081671 RepID=A0A1Y1S8U2_9MICR|nr:hypothetical protein ECANGB1_2783 [Enterospora canceri]
MSSINRKILKIFCITQISLFGLSYLTRMTVQRFDKAESASPLKHLISWDAMHFEQIQEHGYFYEHSMAFFPLHMKIASIVSCYIFNKTVVSIVLNNVYFLISALLIYKIVLILHKPDENKHKTSIFALKTATYFLLNSASVIYSTIYTESLFTLLFLLGFYNYLNGSSVHSACLFSLSTLCRSNGIAFVCFLKPYWIIPFMVPFGIYQLFCILLYWKNNCNFTIIIPYNFIQKTYWNQGFLKFYTLQQLPNIIIGLPSLLLASYSLHSFKFNRLSALLMFKLLMTVTTIHWNMAGRFLAFHPHIHMCMAKISNRYVIYAFLTLRLLYIIMFSAYYPPA